MNPPAPPTASGRPLQRATLVVGRMRDNRPFTPGAGPNGGEFFLPWRQLREAFLAQGVELNTADRNRGHEVAFELHLNAQRRMRRSHHRCCYAYLYEDPIVRPINAERRVLDRYRLVFTSNETLVDGRRILRLDYPNDLSLREVPGWDGRDLHCVLIASNKALLHADPRNLHAARVAVIREFERHAGGRFALYGHGWDIPAVRTGHLGRIEKRLNEWLRKLWPTRRPFPSYRGTVRRKTEVLDRARFCICFENSRGSPGYLTEKIFDCFTSGCVPVYLGTTHAEPPIPAGCFIDADRFATPAELRRFLDSITAVQFEGYQRAMRAFLSSPASARFTNQHFCDTLVARIVADRTGWNPSA
jgi:alpha(1,3/1,4) fucosyltransferase